MLTVSLLTATAGMIPGFLQASGTGSTPPPTFDEQLGVRSVSGALIVGLDRAGPADGAGLRLSDVITGFNGRSIGEFAGLDAATSALREAATFLNADATLLRFDAGTGTCTTSQVSLRLPAEFGARFGMRLATTLVIVEVQEGSPAWKAGLRPCQEVDEIEGEHVANMGGLVGTHQRVLEAGSSRGSVRLTVGHWRPVAGSAEQKIAFEERRELTVPVTRRPAQ
jgi:S1-C subfamily serine protease